MQNKMSKNHIIILCLVIILTIIIIIVTVFFATNYISVNNTDIIIKNGAIIT